MHEKTPLDVHIWHNILYSKIDKTISIQYIHNKTTKHTLTPPKHTPSPLYTTCYKQLRLKSTTYTNKRKICSHQNNYQVLIQSICSHNMSQRPTSYTTGQRYKDAMLALEGNPEAITSVTQKRPSNVERTSNQKNAKGKSTPKRPPFPLSFQAIN